MENETFNTLKNQGDHFEHNFGHGSQHLSVVCAGGDDAGVLRRSGPTVVLSTVPSDWAKRGSKRLLGEKMRALFCDYALDSMEHLFQALYYGLKKSAPVLDLDSSEATAPRRPSQCADPNRRASTTGAELYQNDGQTLHRCELDSLSHASGAAKSTDGFVQ